METIKILEKPASISWDYDEEADVPYLSTGEPRRASGDGYWRWYHLRYDETRKKVVGLTLIRLRERLMKRLAVSE